MYKLQKANKALLRFKYVVKGETKPISKELSKGAIQGASDLGIIWQKGAHGETLDAFGNLLKNYADDSGTIYSKIRELGGRGAAVKDMERVYENGGDLKKALNVVEKSEDGKSVIRWLENGELSSAKIARRV